MFTLKETRGKFILFATILASSMAFLDGSVVGIAVPQIQSQLHADLASIQWVINGYMLLLSALILISGSFSDKFGRRRIFLYGIALFTVASFFCGLSHSINQLIVGRVVQGLGAAMMVPGSLSILNLSFAASERGKIIGMWSGFSGGVSALGPFLGGWLVQQFGWSSIFFINLPLGVLALFLTFAYVPESKNTEAKKTDYWGAVFIFLSLFSLVYGLINGPKDGWSKETLFSLGVGGAFFVIFVVRQLTTSSPLVPFHIFSSSNVAGANLATLFLYFALSGVIFFLVLNFQQVQHYSPLFSGLGMLPAILLITFLSGPAGALADKTGPRLPMVVGPLLVGLGVFSMMIPGLHVNYYTGFMPGLILLGLGMSLVIAPLTKSALSVEEKYSGVASGVNNAIARVAGLFGTALLGAVILFIFSADLEKRVTPSSLTPVQKKIVIAQSTKLAGIEVPSTFDKKSKAMVQESVEKSFVHSFRIVMAINAVLALLSAIVAFILVR